MLCLLEDTCTINYSKLGNWEHRFETNKNHVYPQLREHNFVYRRKLQQAMLIERTGLKELPGIFREMVLEMAEAQSEGLWYVYVKDRLCSITYI